MKDKDFYFEDGTPRFSYEGARRSQLLEFARTSVDDKLKFLEMMLELKKIASESR